MESLEEFAQFIYKTKEITCNNSWTKSRRADHDKLMTLLFGQGCSKNEFMITSCLTPLERNCVPLSKIVAKPTTPKAESMTNAFSIHWSRYTISYSRTHLLLKHPILPQIPWWSYHYVPRFYAIAVHRFAHELYKLNIPYLPRWCRNMHTAVPVLTSIRELQLAAPLPLTMEQECDRWNLHHRKEVKVYQGVTLGALAVEKSHASKKRHPTIATESYFMQVVLSWAGILKSGIISIIGGNVWLTTSVAPFSVVMNTARNRIQNSPLIDETIDWVI